MKLLPASVNPVDPSQTDGSTRLVPVTQAGIAARAGQISLVPSGDAFAWSPATRRGQANYIYGTPVEGSQSEETGWGGEYVSGWAGSDPVESTAIAQYLFYAGGPGGWSGRLIDVYA